MVIVTKAKTKAVATLAVPVGSKLMVAREQLAMMGHGQRAPGDSDEEDAELAELKRKTLLLARGGAARSKPDQDA